MTHSNNAEKIILYYETSGKPEKYLNAYWDKYGKVWTIGIGSTRMLDGSPVKEGDKITLEQAYQLVDRHIEKKIAPRLNKDLPYLKQNQYDALVSLIYNIGYERFANSTLKKYITQNAAPDDIDRAFAMWKKAGGEVQPGLILRRKTEAVLYNTGILNIK